MKAVLQLILVSTWVLACSLPAAVHAQSEPCTAVTVNRMQVAAHESAQIDALRRKHGEFIVSARLVTLFERILAAPAVRIGSGRFIGWRLTGYSAMRINALAGGSGGVLVSRGLDSDRLDSRVIAAALAHEVAHVLLEHGVARTCRKAELDAPALSSLASRVGLTGWPDHVRGEIVDLMRAQELAADELAIDLLRAAGFPPDSLSTLLTELGKAAGGTDRRGALHPSNALRLRHALALERQRSE